MKKNELQTLLNSGYDRESIMDSLNSLLAEGKPYSKITSEDLIKSQLQQGNSPSATILSSNIFDENSASGFQSKEPTSNKNSEKKKLSFFRRRKNAEDLEKQKSITKPPRQKMSKKKKILLVVMSFLVVIALTAAGVYQYMKANERKQEILSREPIRVEAGEFSLTLPGRYIKQNTGSEEAKALIYGDELDNKNYLIIRTVNNAFSGHIAPYNVLDEYMSSTLALKDAEVEKTDLKGIKALKIKYSQEKTKRLKYLLGINNSFIEINVNPNSSDTKGIIDSIEFKESATSIQKGADISLLNIKANIPLGYIQLIEKEKYITFYNEEGNEIICEVLDGKLKKETILETYPGAERIGDNKPVYWLAEKEGTYYIICNLEGAYIFISCDNKECRDFVAETLALA